MTGTTCEQCRSHEPLYIDDEAAFWCGRCAERRVPGEGGFLPYLWLISERRHFLSQVYPTLRYSSFIQDKRNPLWAKKLGIPFVPPGQRAVDQNDPPPAEEQRPASPWAALESWRQAHHTEEAYQCTRELLLDLQASIEGYKRSEEARMKNV